jgi:hypothetical protein
MKRIEDHPMLQHARKITHRAADGKFKAPPPAPAARKKPAGKIAPADPKQ